MGLETLLPIGARLLGSAMSSRAQRSAGNAAAAATREGNDAAIAEQQRQFDAVRKLLEPYVSAGTSALGAQQSLIGLGGTQAQADAIQALQMSPQFTSALKLGEDRILANASATGGLRGGNTQAALGQFAPALLSSMINDQYTRLGGLTSLGQNAAAGVGNAGMATGGNVAQLLQNTGLANAGAALASGRADATMGNGITSAIGQLVGSGALRGLGGSSSPFGGPIYGLADANTMGGLF